MAECEPARRLGCRNKDSCNPAGLGIPFDEGEGKKAVPSMGKKVFSPASG